MSEFSSKDGRADSNVSTFSEASDSLDTDSSINAELGLAEDHFSVPEGHFHLSTLEELEMAIDNCKEMVLEAPEHSDKRRNLVKKLVQLRLKLQEIKEGESAGAGGGPVAAADPSVRAVLGHTFVRRRSRSSKHYCERCNSVIWGVLQQWYRCRECGFCCHAKCLNLITRMCASIKVAESPAYVTSICPEVGLSGQNYRCADCRARLSYGGGLTSVGTAGLQLRPAEPRQCDYTGLLYCSECHWNDALPVPARVLHNWDFTPRKVCRASKQFLKLMVRKPVININTMNPMLYNFVDELNQLQRLREDILIMKQYFLTCRRALESKLLVMLESHQHFVENASTYSLQDLIDADAGSLLPNIQHIHSVYTQHIRDICKLCHAKGFLCELCDRKDVLFCFDERTSTCATCRAVYHRECWLKRCAGVGAGGESACPRCERLGGSRGGTAGGKHPTTATHAMLALPQRQTTDPNANSITNCTA